MNEDRVKSLDLFVLQELLLYKRFFFRYTKSL